ncbi:MAG: (2Fe-2S)-binding protein [Candidatus Aminicenantes bacterium]|nr:(2Fe-2S)-binding protein [Candidatus Aminicenantes bacterium]
MAKKNFTLNVNGKVRQVTAELDEPLLWVLRDNLGLTGTKFGCGSGECGACSVLIDGEVRRSCRVPVAYAALGREITTIEGLGTTGNLSPLQKAFIDHTAFCCGFCTPGMLITATALLAKNPYPSREEIITAMDNNLCRCGSYLNVIEAIEAVIKAT